ncbi:Acetyl-CoA synthetase-like protein [Mycena venus]|uniref:Acetyl-CoA synthetase-like protein n=1 Tax=Mycena venus TaxID=2733690 RepID=A0A8H7CSC6_9AGAR|nr:Acetyl-CoA synthetase-like protein [Mycena venus]
MSPKTHLDILNYRISTHGGRPFYKLLHRDANGSLTWTDVTYSEFGRDIDAVSRHFKSTMGSAGVPNGAVVGMQRVLYGLSYSDIVHMYALCKAGYIPDMITTSLTNAEVVLEMLRESNAKAFLHAPGLGLPKTSEIPTFTPVPVSDFQNLQGEFDFSPAPTYNAEDLAFIQHTSGSTTRPKTVLCTNKWFQSVYNSWTSVWNPVDEDEPQDVFSLPGSVCQPSGFHALCVGIHLGGAFIETSATPGNPLFPADELVQLAVKGGLNRLNTFAPLMIPHIMGAQAQFEAGEDTVLRVLQKMRSIVYGGMPMLPVFEDWGFENKLPLMNTLGTTETGEDLAKCSDNEEQLFALVVLPTSVNIPQRASCDESGKFYTGDLFSQNENGTYSHRGRNGDWIKVGNAYLIDTKTIEEHIKTTCSDLIKEHVIVGTNRPAIALLAEATHPDCGDEGKHTIIQRMTAFHERRMPWERLVWSNILFVPRGTLPRTVRQV